MSSPSRGRTAVTRGVNAHKLATEGRLAHGTASLAERPSFPSVESTRAYLDALMCPFCNLGPFKYPLGHIAHVHGFSSAETRAYLGVPRTHSFSDPDTRAANIAKGLGAPNLSIESRKKGARSEKRNLYETEKQRKLKALKRRPALGNGASERIDLTDALAAAAKAGFEFAEAEWERLGLNENRTGPAA